MKKELTDAIKGLKQRRGFSAMKPEDVKRIASMGGKAVKKLYGRSHLSRIGMVGGKNSHRGDGK